MKLSKEKLALRRRGESLKFQGSASGRIRMAPFSSFLPRRGGGRIPYGIRKGSFGVPQDDRVI